jgi:hypothetical protein
MKNIPEEEIKKFACLLWPEAQKLEVSKDGTIVCMIVVNIDKPPGLSFHILMSLSKFFDTESINDDDRFSYGTCEICDYGPSIHGFTLTIRPE